MFFCRAIESFCWQTDSTFIVLMRFMFTALKMTFVSVARHSPCLQFDCSDQRPSLLDFSFVQIPVTEAKPSENCSHLTFSTIASKALITSPLLPVYLTSRIEIPNDEVSIHQCQ